MSKNSIFRKMSKSINSIYTRILIYGGAKLYKRFYSSQLKRHPARRKESEKYYLQLWSRLCRNPDKNTYRLFSQYIGEDSRIAPEDVTSGIIQPLMNPVSYRGYYQDKNMFDKILSPDIMPSTLLRGMMGGVYTVDYQIVADLESVLAVISEKEECIFVKPTVDTSSGEQVVGFRRRSDGILHSLTDGVAFDKKWLHDYMIDNSDFIIQRGLTQHSAISKFNPTSINTIRIATYRSVADNKPHFLNAILRIGNKGSFVDNAHSGGMFIGINKNGILGKYACDQFGNRYDSFNGINFNTETHIIPDFDTIIDFSEKVASDIIHARLVAQDICLEADGSPKLVEFNIRAFSPWLFQYTVGPAFGDYTDEIIEYCVAHKKDISKVIVEPF